MSGIHGVRSALRVLMYLRLLRICLSHLLHTASCPCSAPPLTFVLHTPHFRTARERKEKLGNAKRYATTVSKSNLGIEARQVRSCSCSAQDPRHAHAGQVYMHLFACVQPPVQFRSRREDVCVCTDTGALSCCIQPVPCCIQPVPHRAPYSICMRGLACSSGDHTRTSGLCAAPQHPGLRLAGLVTEISSCLAPESCFVLLLALLPL